MEECTKIILLVSHYVHLYLVIFIYNLNNVTVVV